VANRKLAGILALIALLMAAPPVAAQPPGLTPPGLTPPGGHVPPQHAIPPVPYALPSPMPTLPPPSRNAPVEPTIGFAIGTPNVIAVIEPDGSIHFDDERVGFWAGADPIVGLAALISFDTTDGAMRAARQDPYLHEKLRIIEATREERMNMRMLHDEMVMQRALDDLPRYLDAVWRQRHWSPEVRRRLLFALWDEAAEDGNEFLRAGGAEARRLIEEFIAYRLPPGTRDGFRARELVRLNRIRDSRQTFDPYAAVATRSAAACALLAAEPALVAMRSFSIR
jgi:hypothetical protein